ncbi:MAG: threonylcarbamoyl-AMP synthase [bacterium]|nr:threonylcarbamoyl-AMP synthase [bacterium]
MAVAATAAERHPAVLEGGEILRSGGLVAFPTETVYGLGADAASTAAVEAVYRVKDRPADNPLIVHLSGVSQLAEIARGEDPRALRLARKFWPGPLTLVVPAREPVRSAACRGLPTVAARVPAHPVALALLRAAGRPIAAPSANLSGRPSPTTAEHVLDDLRGRIPLILDGGPCEVGIESTVVDLSGDEPAVLRPGAVSAEQIAVELGSPVAAAHDTAMARSPGTRYRHYRPRAPVVVIGRGVSPEGARRLVDEARARLGGRRLVGFVATRPPVDAAGVWLLDRREPGALARHLYADLRRFDLRGAALIFVEAVAEDEPVMDRLLRASRHVVKEVGEPPSLPGRILALAESIK